MANRRRRVIWSPSARQALDDSISYIANDSPDSALRVLEEVLNAARRLEEFSERGRIVPEFNDPMLKEIFIYRYRVLYRISVDNVSVVAFLHGARDFTDWARMSE